MWVCRAHSYRAVHLAIVSCDKIEDGSASESNYVGVDAIHFRRRAARNPATLRPKKSGIITFTHNIICNYLRTFFLGDCSQFHAEAVMAGMQDLPANRGKVRTPSSSTVLP